MDSVDKNTAPSSHLWCEQYRASAFVYIGSGALTNCRALDIIVEFDDDRVVRYPGGKGKTYQHVINLLPPHRTYIETHLGGGAVLRHKVRAERTIGIDIDPQVIAMWGDRYPNLATLIEGDAIAFLDEWSFNRDDVIYCDPPYLPSTRRAARVYKFDYQEADHEKLLAKICDLTCRVVISGYESDLYSHLLRSWNLRSFLAKTHEGLREECLWFNFSEPDSLHDPRFLGRDFRQRQNVKRRLTRLKSRISKLSLQEQRVISDWLEKQCGSGADS